MLPKKLVFYPVFVTPSLTLMIKNSYIPNVSVLPNYCCFPVQLGTRLSAPPQPAGGGEIINFCHMFYDPNTAKG